MVRRILLTPRQQFELFFDLRLSSVVRQKVEIDLQLAEGFKYPRKRRTLRAGRPYSALSRTANFVCTVPESILERGKRSILPSLGTYRILVDGRQVSSEDLLPVCIIDNHSYFETETVPEIMEELGFTAIVVGGKNEPDIVAFHERVNPQKIDVEPTLTVEYRLKDLDNDVMKFSRYKTRYNFKRLLAVCECKQISSDVVDELNKAKDPISLIEFRDLLALKLNTRTFQEQLRAYAKLTSTGKITTTYRTGRAVLFKPARFRIGRQI